MATISGAYDPNRASASRNPEVLAELNRLATSLREKPPNEIAPVSVLQTRRQFLDESLRDRAEAATVYERIIGGDDLQPVVYLERGTIAARAVFRIDLAGQGFGTGFLIAPRVLLTNHHVLPDAGTAGSARANFHYEINLADINVGPVVYALRPSELFYTLDDLDFAVVAVEPQSTDGATALSSFGCLPILETVGKVSEGEWLTIIQHPDGGRKKICVRENQFIKRDDKYLWYTTDTKPGSSGSPVFNNDWYVVALHHAGVPEKRDGVIQKNPDGSDKWIANEGVRASRIVKALKQALPNHPLLLPLYAATPASARISAPPTRTVATAALPKGAPMAVDNTLSIPIELTVTLEDGHVGAVSIKTPQSTESLAAPAVVALERTTTRTASFDAPFDIDYGSRKGYDPNFLGAGGKRVGLPKLGPALEAVAAPLIEPEGDNKYILKYHNYSVVMHAERRFAIYSAANITFGDRFELSRPTDVWRRDPRILTKYQIENWYYASNKFDRGHLTRREDLEYGKTVKAALISAADTCHWTNCTPQHSRFNQNKQVWQGIERYILEQSILEDNINATVVTGPILDEGDPEYRKVKYPLQFWKVVAALKPDGSLFATAYIAGQKEIIAQFGIEVTEVPFGPYKTFQTTVAEIERLTGLNFVCGPNDGKALREFDPMQQPAARRRRRQAPPEEAAGLALPEGYFELADVEDIQL
jgi:endonuclease G, mitochondrial